MPSNQNEEEKKYEHFIDKPQWIRVPWNWWKQFVTFLRYSLFFFRSFFVLVVSKSFFDRFDFLCDFFIVPKAIFVFVIEMKYRKKHTKEWKFACSIPSSLCLFQVVSSRFAYFQIEPDGTMWLGMGRNLKYDFPSRRHLTEFRVATSCHRSWWTHKANAFSEMAPPVWKIGIIFWGELSGTRIFVPCPLVSMMIFYQIWFVTTS